MADVFDEKTRIQTRIMEVRLKDDRKLPGGGALAYANITSEGALSGTTGSDCARVHGDRWQQMDGKLVENYTGDKEIEVKGKHSEKTHGDHSLVVVSGNLSRRVGSGGVSEEVAQSHDLAVGAGFSLKATRANLSSAALMDINGGLVRINS